MTKGLERPRYRWAVLAAYMLLSVAIEIQWVAFAPISRAAESFYGVQIPSGSVFGVDFLAMVYLVVFLVVCIPASFAIDTWGLRRGLGIGAILAGSAGVAKGLFAGDFRIVLASQVVLAIAQPFILNAATALAARWFPLRERGLAVGLGTLAQYIGIVVAMVAGPLAVNGDPESSGYGSGVEKLLMLYGIGTAIAAAISLSTIRDAPAGISRRSGEHEPEAERQGAFRGIRTLLASRDYLILLGIFTAGLGIFNALSSMVDALAAHIGVRDSDGLIGTFMLLGGIAGALALPILSDLAARRKPFIVACIAGMLPGVAGLAFAGRIAPDPASAYTVAKIAAGILGFCVMAAGPIGFEYAAEIGRPAPESTSQGLLLLVGQASGILFMALMGETSLLGPLLVVFVVLSAGCFVGSLFLRESELLSRR